MLATVGAIGYAVTKSLPESLGSESHKSLILWLRGGLFRPAAQLGVQISVWGADGGASAVGRVATSNPAAIGRFVL